MDRICDRVFIGNYLDALAPDKLAEAGVRSVLSLDGTLAGADYTGQGIAEIVVVELIDGAGNRPEVFLRAVTIVRPNWLDSSVVAEAVASWAGGVSSVVSAASASQSLSLAINAASYLRFLQASAKFAHTLLDERRT